MNIAASFDTGTLAFIDSLGMPRPHQLHLHVSSKSFQLMNEGVGETGKHRHYTPLFWGQAEEADFHKWLGGMGIRPDLFLSVSMDFLPFGAISARIMSKIDLEMFNALVEAIEFDPKEDDDG